MGFADCKEVSITVSGNIPDSQIYYGFYTPSTPRETWAEGWQISPEYSSFTHFWVEHDNKIIDHAADQFGEKNVIITDNDDLHYVKVGTYDLKSDTCTPLVSDPRIDWGTMNNGVVKVYWKTYDTYMNKFTEQYGKTG